MVGFMSLPPTRNTRLTVDRLSPVAPEQLIIMVLASAFLLLVTLSAFTRVIPMPAFIVNLLDVETEVNLWTWANVLVLSYAALAHMACAGVRYFGGERYGQYWLVSAIIIAALSFDDFVQIHERTEFIGEIVVGEKGLSSHAWIIPGIVIGAICVAALTPLMTTADQVPGRLMISATAFFFIGAIGLDALGGYTASRWGNDYIYDIIVHIEEMFEAFGATLFLGSALADLRGQKSTIMLLVEKKIG